MLLCSLRSTIRLVLVSCAAYCYSAFRIASKRGTGQLVGIEGDPLR